MCGVCLPGWDGIRHDHWGTGKESGVWKTTEMRRSGDWGVQFEVGTERERVGRELDVGREGFVGTPHDVDILGSSFRGFK